MHIRPNQPEAGATALQAPPSPSFAPRPRTQSPDRRNPKKTSSLFRQRDYNGLAKLYKGDRQARKCRGAGLTPEAEGGEGTVRAEADRAGMSGVAWPGR